ncbi:hypothetical protein D3875_02830 [Deinococcus cavernae]|uniref:Uncharacterized protein n=1 Tax=Deinococcus cavernae TaxID=2320857 RepID=A0A418VFT7_9DEIO|nr:hypothetical protein [Deinococcus cavernae]RJF74947.1 hypothetical protein D3875_02830 [Deinococcus cavernae]
MENDTQYKDNLITAVSSSGDGRHSITTNDGWSFFAPKGPITPTPGMVARFYGRGLGCPVRGLVIDGHTFFYQTAADFQAEQERNVAADRQARLDAFSAGRAEQLSTIAQLPEPFQQRLNGFMARRPETAWEDQGYELATCQAAVVILNTCATAEAVRQFGGLKYGEQIQRAPELERMGLSGNMFAVAVRLASFFRESPELIAREHAAICPLVGCERAGCPTLDSQL